MPHLPDAHDRLRLVAREAMSHYTHSHGPLRAPVPIEHLVEWLGFQVVLLYSVADQFSGLVSPGQKLIGVNGRHHRHRQRFSVAHEISHILLRHPPESHCTTRQIEQYNREADLCASELLIPEYLLVKTLSTTSQPDVLARLFDVSEEAMVRKLRVVERA